MNRIQKELLAIRKSAGIYLQYRKNPEVYANDWMLENKGKNFSIWNRKYRSKLKKFYNKHLGEDCFIIGNGPSLNKMNLELLNDYHTFGLNKIYLIFDRMKLNLDYLVSINPFVYTQSKTIFQNLGINKFFAFNNIDQKDIYEDPLVNYLYIKKDGIFFSTDMEKFTGSGFTVTFTAMQLAYYMGFKRVFLIGVDHNFSQDGMANETQKMEGEDVNHFDPNYFKGMQWQLADLDGSEAAYGLAKYYYKKDNRKIFDATVDGNLQIFEKISFEDALEMSNKKSYVG